MDVDELWRYFTTDYNNRRKEILEQLEKLDAWYGDLNVLLSVTSSGRR